MVMHRKVIQISRNLTPLPKTLQANNSLNISTTLNVSPQAFSQIFRVFPPRNSRNCFPLIGCVQSQPIIVSQMLENIKALRFSMSNRPARYNIICVTCADSTIPTPAVK